MKKLLRQLGISITDVSYLLLLPHSTIMSWFERYSYIPAKYGVYLSAFERYADNNSEEVLPALAEEWKKDNQNILDALAEKTLKKLHFDLKRTQLQLEKLQEQQAKQLRRWHLSQKFADYLPSEVRESEQVQDWVSLIGRKSRSKFGDFSIERQKLEQKIAGLEAEVAFWESDKSITQ